jgi:hypothetical protein
MLWIQGETFENQDIKLDFSQWKKCTFRECNLIVKYGEFDLVECSFQSCRITFVDNAKNILRICKLFYPETPTI